MLKKILIAFFLAFFPMVFCCIESDFYVYAYTFDVFQSDFENAPIRDKSSLDTAINNASSISTSDYYIDFFYDYNNYYDDYFVRIYFQNDTNSTPSVSNNRFYYGENSNDSNITFQLFKHDNYSVGSWSSFSLGSPFGNFLNNSLSANYDITLYIIRQSVPCIINNQQYDPPDDVQGDTFICNNDGYNINFGVYCGPASLLEYFDNTNIPYYHTFEYTVEIEFEYNNQTISMFIPSYLYWTAKYDTYIEGDNSDILSYIPMFSPYADVQYSHSMRSIRCYQSDTPSIIFSSDFDKMSDFHSFNTVSIWNILSQANTDYPNLNLNVSDLYTEISIKFYRHVGISDSLVKVYTIDWSSTDSDYVPPEDKGDTPDPFDTVANLNATMTSNNKYLKDILYGEQYIKHGWGDKISTVNIDGLNTIPTPNYTFTEETLDTDALGFFGWLVEWWYSSPFGIISIVSLTFLVIRTIIW